LNNQILKNFRFIPSEKLFLKKYPYKIVLSNNDRKTKNRDILRAEFNSYCERYISNNFSTRIFGISSILKAVGFNIYTDEQTAKSILNGKYKNKVHRIYGPKTDKAFELMTNDCRNIIRKTLFWDNWRYRITYPWVTQEIFENISEIVKKNIECFMISEGYPNRIYLNDEEDLLMLMLSSQDVEIQFEKVILTSEI